VLSTYYLKSLSVPTLLGVDPPRVTPRVPFASVQVLALSNKMDTKAEDPVTVDATTIKPSDEEEQPELSDT
jgi:hypothetical protein